MSVPSSPVAYRVAGTLEEDRAAIERRTVALAPALGERVQVREPLGARTTYRVGGPAALFFEARSLEDLDRLARALEALPAPVPVLVVGRGSNLLVADEGYPGVVVALGEPFSWVRLALGEPTVLRAGGSTPLPVLARRSARLGVAGLEWAVGVPGSVGGAVAMNAGGHGSDTAEALMSVEVFDLATGRSSVRHAASLELGYRRSSLPATSVVTAASLRAVPGGPEVSLRRIAEIVRWRREHQPGGSNAGSAFVNPPGDAAGRLIEASGLKGVRIGSAEVSRKHANFVQADPGGRAGDVRRVLEEVRRVVAEKAGVHLELEVRLVGFDDALGGAWLPC
jgi:UDP-N-acetylmuramate dehydrogenase